MIYDKLSNKINLMREAGKILGSIFNDLYEYIKIKDNITALDIDNFCYERMRFYNVESAAYLYPGDVSPFPAYTCISINEVVCHGIPNDTKIQIGDIVSVDICIKYKDVYSDSCISFIYRQSIYDADLQLIHSGYATMMNTIKTVKPGVHIGTLSNTQEHIAKQHGYNVIREFAGHYIGEQLHLRPLIPFYGTPNTGNAIKYGDTFTIEPMIIKGNSDIYMLQDGWTAISQSANKVVQFEHTILVTQSGHEILTSNKFTDIGRFVV